jgi:hypothetical protein
MISFVSNDKFLPNSERRCHHHQPWRIHPQQQAQSQAGNQTGSQTMMGSQTHINSHELKNETSQNGQKKRRELVAPTQEKYAGHQK